MRKRGGPDTKGGLRSDIGIYVRSSWEANICRYLNWLKEKKEIKSWKYESITFEFPLKKGTRFYTPDFQVLDKDNSTAYWEIKGWMDAKSKTQLKRFKRYYPEEFKKFKIIIYDPFARDKANGEIMAFLLDKLEMKINDILSYKEINNKLGALILKWE